MGVLKAVGYAVVLLAICYGLVHQGYRETLTDFLKDLMGTNPSQVTIREKRAETDTVAIDLILDLQIPAHVLLTNDLNYFRDLLRGLSLPHSINESVNVTDVDLTTVCELNSSEGHRCQCEENFAWSCDKCRTYGSCNSTTGVNGSCGCINELPSTADLCEPIQNITCVTAPVIDIDLVVDLTFDPEVFSSDQLREILGIVPLPYGINPSTKVIDFNLTTECVYNSPESSRCSCAEHFAWSCDHCRNYTACGGNTTADVPTGGPCDCINALPANGDMCEPITSLPQCVTTTPETTTPTITTTTITTTTPNPSTTSTTVRINETTPLAPSSNDTVVFNLIVNLRIPLSLLELSDLDSVRSALNAIDFPHPVNDFLKVDDVNLTTVCEPTSADGFKCQCEEQFAWSCHQCETYGVCGNTSRSNDSCGCINALPPTDLCEPITSITPCPTPTPSATTTTPITTSTTSLTTTTPFTTTTTPFTTTTTPFTTTTTPFTTTTTSLTTTTTSFTTTPTKRTTTTTPLVPETPEPLVMEMSVSLDIQYKPEYNNPENEVHKRVLAVIKANSKANIETLTSVKILRFRNGSTIVDYAVEAISFPEINLQAMKDGIFTDLAESYPMIHQSSKFLSFERPFLGRPVTLTCGPIPSFLGFTAQWTAEWRRNKTLILADSEHEITKHGDSSTLKVKRFFLTDKGYYECRLKDKHVFRQISNGVLSAKRTPDIQVTPVRQKVMCEPGKTISLQCSVKEPYKVKFKDLSVEPGLSIEHVYTVTPNCSTSTVTFVCQEVTYPTLFDKTITLDLVEGSFLCVGDNVYGVGNLGDRAVVSCEEDEVGEKIAECQKNGSWIIIEEDCVLKPIQELLDQSVHLNNNSLPEFLEELSFTTTFFSEEVVESPNNIDSIVNILNNVAETVLSEGIEIGQSLMEDILSTVGILTTDGAKEAWENINSGSSSRSSLRSTRSTFNGSSSFLRAIEDITSRLNNQSFNIQTPFVTLNKTTFADSFVESFSADANSSVELYIPEAYSGVNRITVITFSSLDNVLPPRDKDNASSNVINGKVVLIQSSGSGFENISLTFDVLNDTLEEPQCVYWNFSLFDGLGGWDDQGCELTYDVNDTDINATATVTCTCNHLTSFSILMSPITIDLPILDYITYIGVGISMLSLVICLIIEAIIWRKIRGNNTAYLRHVSIVNIAVSLLIADIWFIIGAAISDSEVKNPPACTAATFFIHLFYLALFFWMLASALLLLYRIVSDFGGSLSKASLLAIGFVIGYGVPLLIAVITIAVTAPVDKYTRERGVCWLNWNKSKALLAFVIPALLIVAINFLILLLVLYKMLRRRAVPDAAHPAERNALVVIARTLAFLTPFFGLTWGLGVGTMTNPTSIGTHIAFAFFNSLQGFFILVFGTLLDKQVWTEIARMSQTSSGTRSTTAGYSSSGLGGIFTNRRRGYNISSQESTSHANT